MEKEARLPGNEVEESQCSEGEVFVIVLLGFSVQGFLVTLSVVNQGV